MRQPWPISFRQACAYAKRTTAWLAVVHTTAHALQLRWPHLSCPGHCAPASWKTNLQSAPSPFPNLILLLIRTQSNQMPNWGHNSCKRHRSAVRNTAHSRASWQWAAACSASNWVSFSCMWTEWWNLQCTQGSLHEWSSSTRTRPSRRTPPERTASNWCLLRNHERPATWGKGWLAPGKRSIEVACKNYSIW